MKTIMFFALLIGTPLTYLWQHAFSFKLCQQIAKMEEQKRRALEVNDSLQACLASLSSVCGLESRALALGLEPRIKLGSIVVPAAFALSHKTSKVAASTSPSMTQKTVAATGDGGAQKPTTAAAAAKPLKPVAVRSSQSGKCTSSSLSQASGNANASKLASGRTDPARAGQAQNNVAADEIVGAPARPNPGGMWSGSH